MKTADFRSACRRSASGASLFVAPPVNLLLRADDRTFVPHNASLGMPSVGLSSQTTLRSVFGLLTTLCIPESASKLALQTRQAGLEENRPIGRASWLYCVMITH